MSNSSAVKPRTWRKPESDQHNNYETLNEIPAKIFKVTPQNIPTTGTLQQHLKKPMRDDSLHSSSFPSEDEILSLSVVVDKYSHLLPLRVRAVSGFMAENEGDPTIYMDDLYNLHAVKQSEVVTIVDSRRQKYRLPLNSAAKFGLICDLAAVYSVNDLHNAETRPPVVVAMSTESNFKENEILVVDTLRKIGANQITVLKVFSINERKEKYIPNSKDCNVRFSTDPARTKLYLSEIMKHLSHVLPCPAQLFISQDTVKLPKHLTTKQVMIHQQSVETSVIISLHLSKIEKVYIDIPVSINIDVRVLRPETSNTDYASLYEDSRTLIADYDPTKLQACVNANDDDTYITQAQLLKALRQGYETAGTTIKTSGEEHIYQPLAQITEPLCTYQDVVYPAKEKKQEPKIPTTELPQYEDVDFRPLLLSTSPPHALVPAPSQTSPPVMVSRSLKPLVHPPTSKNVPSPVLSSKQPNASRSVAPTPVSVRPKVRPKVPPKSTAAQNNDTLSSPTVVYDRIPKRPVAVPALQPKNVSISSSANSAEPVRSDHDSRKRFNSHLKASVQQQSMSSPPLSVESPAPVEKPQPDVSASKDSSNSKTTKEDQSTYGTALYAINESLRLLLGKIEKMEQRQEQFEADVSLLKDKTGNRNEKKPPLEVCSMTKQDVQQLLDAMGMPQYKATFLKEWVDGEVFKDLDDEALLELGVTSKLHRLKLKNVITGIHSLDKFLLGT